MQVAGKVVVVTGGANGIGRALCEAFHRAGAAKVVVADLDLAGAQAVAASIDGAAFKCDVGQEQDIRHVIEETERQFGPIARRCRLLPLIRCFLPRWTATAESFCTTLSRPTVSSVP